MGRSLILDANLLVLLVVGMTDRALITRHKRLQAFLPEDYDFLCTIVEGVDQLIVTPNTLTETSNLLRQIEDPVKTKILDTFRARVLKTDERYLASNTATRAAEFVRLGLTDSVLLQLGDKSRSLLTTDLGLYLAACRRGLPAVNFNHIRPSLAQ